MPQIFVDLDGVLADFYGFCKSQFGPEFAVDQEDPTELFRRIREHGSFYRDQPLLPDAVELWRGLLFFHSKPIILTGVPYSVPDAAKQKQDWVKHYFGFTTPLICCHSKDKYKHGKKGDILIDDRTKYSKYWLDMGGIFVLHTSAVDTLRQLRGLWARW